MMNKKLFILLVVLMSLSLVGIIFVQGYWIKTSVEDKEEQFSILANQLISNVAEKIEKQELKDYTSQYLKLRDSLGELKGAQLTELFYVYKDDRTDQLTIYSNGVLEEDYGITSDMFFDNNMLDTTVIKNYTSIQTRKTYDFSKTPDDLRSFSNEPINRADRISRLTEMDKIQFEDMVNQMGPLVPIHKRVSKFQIELLLQNELSNNDIDTDFEYSIYDRGYSTKVRSKNFEKSLATYGAPLFSNAEGKSNYSLFVTFPEKKKFLLSSVMGMALLSMLFTLVIVVAYSSAIYQLIKQKQISEIKTDFINNMTHEFKTPIATINLALDAVRNPKIISDQDKVSKYLQMIKEENKRMHAQVENVLRISKLEKNQLDIRKDRVDLHDLIDDAINHVSLIVEDRGGYIKTHLDAEQTEILANDTHFTNVIVNVLDNAVKYSKERPEIDVYTEVVKNNIVLKVQDKGLGMSKAVLKKIFEKFYREPTGNIHNVKGHGLGLAYVKKIVEDHQGEIYAESEKDKGSTFYIKLPLI